MSIQPDQTEPVVLTPVGRLDAAAVPHFGQEIDAALKLNSRYIIVNLSRVPHLSSSALRVLLTGLKRARAAGGTLALCSLQPNVLRVVQRAGFDRLLAIYETEDQARSALSSSSVAPPIRQEKQ